MQQTAPSQAEPILKPDTLKISASFGKTFLVSLAMLAILWGISELFLRLLVLGNIMAPPPVGSYNAEFDIKLQLLDQLVKEQGKVNCVFIGSSQLDGAIDPQVFASAYHTNSGKEITCFNFSVATLTASPAGKIAMIIAQRYKPQVIIYGTSARDYSTNFGEWARPLLDDPWVQYSLGQFNLRGWLIDHSYGIRGLVALRKALNPDYHEFLNRLRQELTPYGFMPGEGSNTDNPKDNFIPEYQLASEDMSGLDEILRLDSPQLQVILIEVPVHASFLPHYVESNPQAYQDKFINPLSDIAQAHGVPFWRTIPNLSNSIPNTGWGDIKHLNSEGAKIFSTWLARQFDQFMQQKNTTLLLEKAS